MPNHLISETSPYLLQHQENPVDWYPWGDEALCRSKEENKPIFLSIGYSACHWCHVMERESFESDAIAESLNKNFICIKVDREERPDLDQIYMNAVILMNGRGGWPMSLFLTPDLRPYFGGTYWPPTSQGGMPGFDRVIEATAEAWQSRREQVFQQSEKIVESLQQFDKVGDHGKSANLDLLQAASVKLNSAFDHANGGFGGAPKFPRTLDLALLSRIWRRQKKEGLLDMVRLTLDKMAAGGIYDHLGGGFARYSVDERWLVPHFEKMLYDNALLINAYIEGYQATGDEAYAHTARETIEYVLRDMTDPAGGFYSSEDADSEGVEGKFYVWTPDEVREVLGDEASEKFCYVYDVTPEGNFEEKNILNLPKSIEQCAKIKEWDEAELREGLANSRQKLLAARNKRIRPDRDDKVLVSWNGLMIDALARAAGALEEPRFLEAAERAACFLLDSLCREEGRLLHTWREGKAKLDAYLDDYACLANALVSLYETSFNERWIDEAVRLADLMLLHFRDNSAGGFFFTADDHEKLITRQKDIQDGSVPSSSGMAATLLMRLGTLCGRADYITAARETIDTAVGLMSEAPTAGGQMLIALDLALGPFHEMVFLGDTTSDNTGAVLADLRRRFLPRKVVACRPDSDNENGSIELDPLFTGRTVQGDPSLYLCYGFTCQAPVSGKEPVIAAIERLETEAK